MKKINLVRMLIFGMIFILFGCSEDLYEEKNQNEKLKVSHKKFEDLIHYKKFNNAINNVLKIKSNHSNVAKTIMEDQYGFTISDKPVNVIENDSVTSYTLFVTRDSSAVNSIENLIIQVNQQNITSAYLLKYTSNTNLPLGNDMKDFEGTKTIFPIIYNSNQSSVTNKEIYRDCNVIQSWFCYGDGHHETAAGCTMGWATFETVCNVIESDGGGGYGNNGSSNTNSGEILTVPHGGSGSDLTPVANPCKKIKKQLDKFASLKPGLVTLKGTTSQNHENGIYIDNTATATTPNPIQNLPATTTQGASVGLPNLPSPNKYTIIAHTHDAVGSSNLGTYSIFSWGDLSVIADKIRLGQIDTDNFVFYVITADNTIYALTIDWPSIFSEYFDVSYVPDNPSLNFNSAKFAKLVQTSETYYKDGASVGSGKIGLATNATDDLKIFLQMLKDTKLDVSLFEVDPTFTTYTKKTLSSEGTVTSGTPCN